MVNLMEEYVRIQLEKGENNIDARNISDGIRIRVLEFIKFQLIKF